MVRLKIGAFARLGQVSVKLLRYYDEIGLLKPAQVDDASGYRYYAMDQLPRLNRVLALKDLGLSLEQVTMLLREDLPLAQLQGMLRLKQAEVQQRVAEEQARLTRVGDRLRQIEQEGTLPHYDVLLKQVEAQWVAGIRGLLTAPPEVGCLISEVGQYVWPLGVAAYNAALWFDMERADSLEDAAGLIYLDKPIPPQGRIEVYQLPAVETMACVVHHGSYANFNRAYNAILSWIAANGYTVTAASREVYLEGGSEQDNESYVTEIQFPVTKLS